MTCKLILTSQRFTKRDSRGYVYFYEYEHKDFRQIPKPVETYPDDSKFDRPEVMEIRWVNSTADLGSIEWNDENLTNMIAYRLIRARLKNEKSIDEIKYEKAIQRER